MGLHYKSIKHGGRYLKEYRTWIDIRRRCNNPNYKDYKNYGAKGIKVCDRWLNSFENFYADMGPRPSNKHSIDRIDNDGNYEPNNCRWATAKTQINNRNCSKFITYKGKKMHLNYWAKKYDINRNTLYSRIYTLNWSIEKALGVSND